MRFGVPSLWLKAGLLIVMAIVGLSACDDESPRRQSVYVKVSDGTRLAVDIWLPRNARIGKRWPAAVRMTRYWRSAKTASGKLEDDANYADAQLWNAAGYAMVVIDARGSGASFGTRASELSDRELSDYSEVIDWIAKQAWSNGRLGTFGWSYDGDTAELVARLKNPHVKAIAPLSSDFEVYEGVLLPGGILHAGFAAMWSIQNEMLDGVPGAIERYAAQLGIDPEELRRSLGEPRAVDEANGLGLLREAIAQHANNTPLASLLKGIEFRDDELIAGRTLDHLSPFQHAREIETSGVPIFVQASWVDGAVADGTLARFKAFTNTQEIHIGAWSHGGEVDVDPFKDPDAALDISREQQVRQVIAFFDRYVKGKARPDGSKRIHYYTLGEQRWRSTDRWPIAGVATRTLYLDENHTLSEAAPAANATDVYTVDPSTGTGMSNRWWVQALGGDVVYPDRAAADASLLVYDSEALQNDVRMTGEAVIHLSMAANQADAALFAYLEDVAPDGRVTYVTEGQLRLINRLEQSSSEPHRALRVPRSFERSDAEPMPAGAFTTVKLNLLTTSALFRRGHRIRLAIGGADSDSFAPYPADGAPTQLTIRRGTTASKIELPIAPAD